MPERIVTPERVLASLTATPPRLAALTAGVDPARLQARATPDEWSAVEVLAHMRACADMWGQAIAAILAADRPTLRAVNPRSWIKHTDYADQAWQPSLQAFTAQRTALLAVLDALAPADWARTAIVTGAGAPLERTVLFYAEWLAHHERPHVRQIARRVAALPR